MVRCKVDGYNFGDRLLEGVNFAVTIDPTTVKVVAVELHNPRDKEYFETLNTAHWLKVAEEYVQEELDDGIESIPVTETELKNYLRDDCCFIVL
jgi:hypothetical protein